MKETVRETHEWLKALGEHDPGKMAGFHMMMRAILEQDALDKKVKHLIGVALAVSRQCRWCIAYHVQHALGEGATDAEILGAAWMAVLLGGAPALMYAGLVSDALEAFQSGNFQ